MILFLLKQNNEQNKYCMSVFFFCKISKNLNLKTIINDE